MLSQKFFYPLYDQFDKDFFQKLILAVNEKYNFVGTLEDKRFFLKGLLCYQMLKDYRKPLFAVEKNLSKQTEIAKINNETKDMDFSLDFSWMVWTRDKEMGEIVKKIFNSDLEIIGNDQDYDEFILRYLISIWLIDWEGPLYVISKSVEEGVVKLRELNEILALWDFTKIFAQYK